MKIYGIGFDKNNPDNYEHYFLTKLREEIPSMEITNEIPDDGEVLVVNLTRESGPKLFGSLLPDEKVFKIVIVHELYRTTLPFLKLADVVVYTNDYQRRVCEDLLNLHYNNVVMPLPGGDFEQPSVDDKSCLVYFDYPFNETNRDFFETNIKKPVDKKVNGDFKSFNFVIPVEEGAEALYKEISELGKTLDERYSFYNANELSKAELQGLIKKSTHGQYLKNEMDFDQYEGFMAKRTSGMVHELIVDSPFLADMAHAGVELLDITDITALNYSKGNKKTYKEWGSFITDLIENEYEKSLESKQDFLDALEFDTLDDVIIEYGAPLSNQYIFSICFRNQEAKIQRCIESIKEQNRDLDFGVVLVNDCSEDKSIEKIIESLEGSGVDACVVTNKKRNFAARNFYNVVNLYTTNDESVIIEVDGDDFLNGTEVLDTLEKYYSKGALKTNGSYKMYPDGQDFMGEADVKRNHECMDYTNPWNLDRCNAWLHLRTSKRKLIRAVEINHFLDRNTHSWLPDRHDAAIQPRIIELSEGKSMFVEEILYNYDISGDNHDHDNEAWEEEHLKLYGHMSKIYHPLILG